MGKEDEVLQVTSKVKETFIEAAKVTSKTAREADKVACKDLTGQVVWIDNPVSSNKAWVPLRTSVKGRTTLPILVRVDKTDDSRRLETSDRISASKIRDSTETDNNRVIAKIQVSSNNDPEAGIWTLTVNSKLSML